MCTALVWSTVFINISISTILAQWFGILSIFLVFCRFPLLFLSRCVCVSSLFSPPYFFFGYITSLYNKCVCLCWFLFYSNPVWFCFYYFLFVRYESTEIWFRYSSRMFRWDEIFSAIYFINFVHRFGVYLNDWICYPYKWYVLCVKCSVVFLCVRCSIFCSLSRSADCVKHFSRRMLFIALVQCFFQRTHTYWNSLHLKLF